MPPYPNMRIGNLEPVRVIIILCPFLGNGTVFLGARDRGAIQATKLAPESEA